MIIPPTGNQLPKAKGILLIPADQPACAAYCKAKKKTPTMEIPMKYILLIQISTPRRLIQLKGVAFIPSYFFMMPTVSIKIRPKTVRTIPEKIVIRRFFLAFAEKSYFSST